MVYENKYHDWFLVLSLSQIDNILLQTVFHNQNLVSVIANILTKQDNKNNTVNKNKNTNKRYVNKNTNQDPNLYNQYNQYNLYK